MIALDLGGVAVFGRDLVRKLEDANEAMWKLGNPIDVIVVGATQHKTLERDYGMKGNIIETDCSVIRVVCGPGA